MGGNIKNDELVEKSKQVTSFKRTTEKQPKGQLCEGTSSFPPMKQDTSQILKIAEKEPQVKGSDTAENVCSFFKQHRKFLM